MGDQINNDYPDIEDRDSLLIGNNANADENNTTNTEMDNQLHINGSSTAVAILHKGQDSLSINIVEENSGMFYRSKHIQIFFIFMSRCCVS